MAWTRTILGGTVTADVTYTNDVYIKGPEPWADVKAYGAVGDGTTDDLSAFNSAKAALATTGGVIYVPPGTYALSGQFVLGDGSDSQVSSKSNIALVGAGVGSDNDIFTDNRYASRLKRITNSGDAVVKVAGPISGVRIANIALDANALAANGLGVYHAYGADFENILVVGHTGYGIIDTSYDPAPSGVSVGARDALWANVIVGEGSGTAWGGIKVGETATDGAVYPVNHRAYIRCSFGRYGTATNSILLGFADNITFVSCLTPGKTGANDGNGVNLTAPTGATAYPKEVSFLNSSITGGVTTAGGWSPTQGVAFIPYPTADSQVTPTATGVYGMDYKGQFFGGVSGVPFITHGSTGASTLATSGTEYISCVTSILNSTEANVQATVEKGAVLTFSVDLDTVPGGTATRTFTLRKNAADTAGVITFTAAESGVKSYTTAVTVAAGDKLAVSSTTANTPTASRARVRMKMELRP